MVIHEFIIDLFAPLKAVIHGVVAGADVRYYSLFHSGPIFMVLQKVEAD